MSARRGSLSRRRAYLRLTQYLLGRIGAPPPVSYIVYTYSFARLAGYFERRDARPATGQRSLAARGKKKNGQATYAIKLRQAQSSRRKGVY